MKRTIKSTVVSLSMFALVALSAMPAAAYSPEGSVQASQPATSTIVARDAEFSTAIGTPAPTSSVTRRLAPARNAGTPWGNFLNGFKRP